MGDTSVTVVRPHTSRNVVRIDATAIIIGTNARNEPNTNASTSSAPTPPSIASSSTPGPLPPPLCDRQRVVAGEVHRCARHGRPRERRGRVFGRFRVGFEGMVGSGGG